MYKDELPKQFINKKANFDSHNHVFELYMN